MRILLNHSDFIEYTPIEKEIRNAEEAEKKTVRYENIVVLFTSVEKDDSVSIAKKAVDEIKKSLEVIKCNKILIYPFVHLTNNPASAELALKVLKEMEKYAKESGLETYRSPFGWNKQYNLKIKGHPLAEQSKVFSKEDVKEIPEAVKAEEKLKSFWHVIDTQGNMVPVEEFDFKGHDKLKKLTDYEIAKSRTVKQMPPHITLMRKMEIADFEPGSDPGNLRYYPKGRLIKSLLETFVTQRVIEYGGMEVETPIMYDFAHPILANYLNRFPARQYVVKSDEKEFFLRFSACFGQFLMAKDSQFSYKQLPYKIYELTRYSFRREKSGELVGLRRLRAFTMPDVHALCADFNQAKEEFVIRFNLCKNVLKDCGINDPDYEMALRFTKDFYNENKDFINNLVKLQDKPVLVEMWEQRFFYFVLKYEFNFIDNLDKASALSTDQIDVENGERYGITYIDKNDKKQNPIILHCSPSGAIERIMYALLEKAYTESKEGKNPLFPLWLSPIQVRICPMNDDFIKFSEDVMNELENSCIRADVDDRVERIEKKVRDAEMEWIPFIVVIGKKEKESGKLAVRIRETGKIENITLKELAERIREQTKGYPFKQLSLPKLITKRPKFV
ncbi:threonine--tRNA ligase [Candidatus Micrarchaeota archaeon RBG_16_36_9]|nr:MAG: threonine--tRNA ligase [Candidatus Micrarchaeota archaeon RBG_16_36_9]